MKTNILWKGSIVGTISGKHPDLNMLPPKLLAKCRSVLSLQEQPKQSPLAEFTDVDGGIYGVRFFDFHPASDGPGFLISPTTRMVWVSAKASTTFVNSQAVRGHKGFHAAWPKSLRDWLQASVDHHMTQVKALVKGYGDLVCGDMGWRSERMEIIECVIDHTEHAMQIQERYHVTVRADRVVNPAEEYEPIVIEWTPEFKAWLDINFPPPKPRRSRNFDQDRIAMNF